MRVYPNELAGLNGSRRADTTIVWKLEISDGA
jgi:hypothetical protein